MSRTNLVNVVDYGMSSRSASRRISGISESLRGSLRDQLSFSRETFSSSSLEPCVAPIRDAMEEKIKKEKKRKLTYVSNERGLQHRHIIDENNFRIKYYSKFLNLRNVSGSLSTQTRKSKMMIANRAPLQAEDLWNNNNFETPELLPLSPQCSRDHAGVFEDMFEQ